MHGETIKIKKIRNFVGLFHGQFICFFVPRYPVMLRCPHRSDLVASTYFFYRLHTLINKGRFNGGFSELAVAAILSEQVCLLLLGTFLDTRSCAHLRIVISWD